MPRGGAVSARLQALGCYVCARTRAREEGHVTRLALQPLLLRHGHGLEQVLLRLQQPPHVHVAQTAEVPRVAVVGVETDRARELEACLQKARARPQSTRGAGAGANNGIREDPCGTGLVIAPELVNTVTKLHAQIRQVIAHVRVAACTRVQGSGEARRTYFLY